MSKYFLSATDEARIPSSTLSCHEPVPLPSVKHHHQVGGYISYYPNWFVLERES